MNWSSRGITVFDLFIADQFLDPVARATALDDVRAAAGAAATVHGHGRTDAASRVRHAIQLAVSAATRRPIEDPMPNSGGTDADAHVPVLHRAAGRIPAERVTAGNRDA
jgi:hypothetical protein